MKRLNPTNPALYSDMLNKEFKDTYAARLASRILRDFKQRENMTENKRVPPFQFTLPLLQAIYRDLLGKDFEIHAQNTQNKYKDLLRKDYGILASSTQNEFCKLLEKDSENVARHGQITTTATEYIEKKINTAIISRVVLHAPDPKDQDWAMQQSIRAIEYLSWDEETRMFLARRIYPIYFDFISYSSCHEGWGIVGHMLKTVCENPSETWVPSPPFSQRALPFLREVERLKFKSIFAFPVLKKSPTAGKKMASSNVHGAYVVFLKSKTCLPMHVRRSRKIKADTAKFDAYFKGIAAATSRILKVQDNLLGINQENHLGALWLDQFQNSKKRPVCLFEIAVKMPREKNRHDVYSKILSQIAISEQFVVVKEPVNGSHDLVLLAAPSDTSLSMSPEDFGSLELCKVNLKRAILRAVGPEVDFEIHLKNRP